MWPKFPDICLTVMENPRKKISTGKLTRQDTEPEAAGCESTTLPPDHSDCKNWLMFVAYLKMFSSFDEVGEQFYRRNRR